MARNLKTSSVIIIGHSGQGFVADAIKEVIDNQLERGITITEMLEKENSISYVNIYRENIEPLEEIFNKVYFDKPKSKFHR
jgi:carbonic anhydrase